MAQVAGKAALVEALPESDQRPSPSSLVARTCTWYAVLGDRFVMDAFMLVWSCGPLNQGPLLPSRYCRS